MQGLAAVHQGAPQDRLAWLAHTLEMGASLVWEACQLEQLLRDPTSHLPGRAQFQAQLKSLFLAAGDNGQPLGLLLINPDEFGAINERLDRESGDRAVVEVARIVRECLRQSDMVFRYGGAVFAVLMPKADEEAVDAVAAKLHRSLTGAYLDGAVRLTFSVGAAVYRGGEEDDAALDDLGLVRRADHALNMAKRAGGGCSVTWNADDLKLPGIGVDRLSGIFTADAEKDYRNMLLLWDTIAVISASAQKDQIAREFVSRINLALKPERVALLEHTADTGFRPLAVAQRSDAAGMARFELSGPQQALLESVLDSRSSEKMEFESSAEDGAGSRRSTGYALPILADKRCLGCLYIDGPGYSLALDSSDLIFLDALAGQLGLALDRVELAARWREETERESKRLREEVHDLRQVVQSARLVYSSQQMHTVLDTLRAVAPTDVTILINGESGTGKEMLARSVHELSLRKGKPLITVDCGAIAHNLMEAELFGYTKGAFTGANTASQGRIAQAEGGTLFLDEIGEIPLDVQAKLLRFVQEKEINPVGATRSRRVDTRIVAATNRDLAAEAAAGRFREDLYYRLKVVTVSAPTLRERPDDILPLARHFLEKFALQYARPVRRFSPEAEGYLLHYEWPGNVRELQNSILRAVVLCAEESIPAKLLQAHNENGGISALAPQPPVPPGPAVAAARQAAPPAVGEAHPSPAAYEGFSPGQDPWLALRHGLAQQVETALAAGGSALVPLGRWLTEDLVLAADGLFRGNARRAASELQIAETTYRRQLEKAQRAELQGLLSRTPGWAAMRPVLAHLLQSIRGLVSANVVDQARSLLLAEVEVRVGGNDDLGSALMGITVPTYRRWTAKP
jgi:diguanylate cyclase (GGDEF)-like protein